MMLVLIAMLLCTPAEESLTVAHVEGTVTSGGASLSVGSVLHVGDTVQTQQGGRIEIAIPGGSLIRLGENSRFIISVAEPRKHFNLRLLIGDLWTRVHKLLGGESFEIETENGVAGVRGTEFRVAVETDQPDLLRVYEGDVQVQGRYERWSHQVGPGNELRFRREASPPQPFDPAGESGHAFMQWVKSRPTRDGTEPGRVREHERRKEDKEERQRQRRERPHQR